jgi:hypothetical protein
MSWLEDVLISYRASLGYDNTKPMLLLRDGFKCHIAKETKAICLANIIADGIFTAHDAFDTTVRCWHL